MPKPQSDPTQESVRRLNRLVYGLLGCWVVTGFLLAGLVWLLLERVRDLQGKLEQSSHQQVPEGFWSFSSPLIASIGKDLACGFFLMLCAAFVLRVLRLGNVSPADSEGQVLFFSRVARLFEKWSEDLPDQTALIKLFTEAKIVDIYGTTFYQILIDSEEFPNCLRQRLQDKKKTTRILLLAPDGQEMKRRIEKSTHAQDLITRVTNCHNVLDPIAKEFPKKKFYFTFDHATTFAMLRFDNIAYVNLQLLTKCGSSPGLEVKENGWLFPHYAAEFESAWEQFDQPAAT